MKHFVLLFSVLLLLAGCKEATQSIEKPESDTPVYSLVIHGGAGGIKREYFSEEQQEAYRQKLQEALDAGYAVLEEGGAAIEAVQIAINIMEDSPLFNAGKGSVYNSEGNQEMDAAIMDGKSLNSGAVAGINHIKNPILAARVVMDSSKHVLLSGKGAEIMAEMYGIEMVDSTYFFDERRLNQLQRAQDNEKPEDAQAALFHRGLPDDRKHGTVGAVAYDQAGNIVAGTSTGGMTNKKYGRIGDVPVIGAGTYANNLTCGISATGTGEYFIRTVAAHEVSSLIRYGNMSPDEALNEVLFNQIGPLGGEGGMILIDSKGDVYWDFNSTGMFRGMKTSKGENKVAMFEKQD
jgi:beta-aspartyl-peptidase (threonine type)